MGDSQDSCDEIHSISQRLRTVTTIDNINSASPASGSGNKPRSSITNTPNTVGRTAKTERFVNPELKDRGTHKEEKEKEVEEEEMAYLESTENYGGGEVRNLPELNIAEKIVLIIDVTQEPNCTKFKLGTGATYMPMFMVKRVTEIFVVAKSMIKRNHEFAIMILYQDSVKWICDFTNNIKTVLNALDALVVEDDLDEDKNNFFDLSQIFETINSHVHYTAMDSANPDLNPPPFTIRAILIYSRSNSIPIFKNGRKYFDILYKNPYFVLDCLFVHEPPDADNKCEEVYTELASLDAKNLSYILEVGRNATKLHDNMAKLLAHPLQRPLQKNASYNISLSQTAGGSGAEEIQINV